MFKNIFDTYKDKEEYISIHTYIHKHIYINILIQIPQDEMNTGTYGLKEKTHIYIPPGKN